MMFENVAVGVFTGVDYYHRAKAIKETWGSYFENIFYHGFTPDSSLPITQVPITGPHTEDYQSALYKEILGLKQMFDECSNVEWYFSCGCDTYAHPRNLVETLSRFPSDQPLLIGGHCGEIRRRNHLRNVKRPSLLNYLRYFPSRLRYPSGGAGFALSRTLLEQIRPYLDDLIKWWEMTWKAGAPLSFAADVCVTYGVHRFAGVRVTETKGFYALHWIRYVSSAQLARPGILSPDLQKRFGNQVGDHSTTSPLVDRPISFHYLEPDDMVAVHKRAKERQFPFDKSSPL